MSANWPLSQFNQLRPPTDLSEATIFQLCVALFSIEQYMNATTTHQGAYKIKIFSTDPIFCGKIPRDTVKFGSGVLQHKCHHDVPLSRTNIVCIVFLPTPVNPAYPHQLELLTHTSQ